MAKPNGQLIRELRRRKGLTVIQLARRAGVAERTLRKLERDETEIPYPGTIASIAGALNTSPEELFEGAPMLAKAEGDRPKSAEIVRKRIAAIDPTAARVPTWRTSPLERLARGVFVGREGELVRRRIPRGGSSPRSAW